MLGENGIYIPCELRVDPIQSPQFFEEDFGAIDPLEQSWDAIPRFRRRFQRITFDWVLQHRSPAVILGSAGSGKTTTLKAEALKMVRSSRALLPLYIECRDLVPFLLRNRKTGIWDLLEEYQGVPPNHSFEDSLIKGEVVVFVDGLDEVGGETVEEAINRLHLVWDLLEYLFKTYNKCKWVVSTRYLGITSLHRRFSNYACFEICPFEPQDIPLFTTRWFRSANMRESFIQQVNIPQLRNLATNPLLITFMAILVQKGWPLPKSRTRLYQDIVNLLTNEWDERRGIERPRNPNLTRDMSLGFLGNVAHRIQEMRRRYIGRTETIDFINEYFQPLTRDFRAESLLIELSTHGIFRETARDWFGFLHRTFQEYFAALALRQSVDELLLHRHEIWWREVLVLAGEMLASDDWYVALLRQREDVFHSNLLLAGRCVATSKTPNLSMEVWVIARLTSLLLESPYEAVCSEIVEILIQIGTRETVQIIVDVIKEDDRSFLRRIAAYQLQSVNWADFPDIAAELSNHILARLPITSSSAGESQHLIKLLGCIFHFTRRPDCERIVGALSEGSIDQRVRAWLAEAVGDIVFESLGRASFQLLLDRQIPRIARQALAQHILSIRHSVDHEDIVQLLTNDALDDGVSAHILMALKDVESLALSETLIDLLPQNNRKPKENTKTLIALALVNHLDARIATRLDDLRHSPNVSSRVKESLRYPLWKYDIEPLSGLLDLLVSPNLSELFKVSIAREIEPVVPPEMLPQILDHVLDNKCDSGVRKILLEVLEKYGDPTVAYELIKLLPDENCGEPIRKKVTDVVGTLGGPYHIDMLLNLATDESLNPSVRWRLFIAVARIIRRLPQRQHDATVKSILEKISPLLNLETPKPSMYVLRGVILSLGQMGSSLTIDPLRNLFMQGILCQETFHALKENAQTVGQTIWPEDLNWRPIEYELPPKYSRET